jgi:hypothetical protein
VAILGSGRHVVASILRQDSGVVVEKRHAIGIGGYFWKESCRAIARSSSFCAASSIAYLPGIEKGADRGAEATSMQRGLDLSL